MPDWEKPTPQQKYKVQNNLCKHWTDIKVYLHEKDKRPGKRHIYGCIEIKFTDNGNQKNTIISAHCASEHKGNPIHYQKGNYDY